MANKQKITRYKPFENHEDEAYHSPSLPLPNVVRIEVLSPAAKARYLGKFHSMMEGFRQKLTEQMMYGDATKPFYAFFDPKQNGGIGLDLTANWQRSQSTGVNALVNTMKSIPKIGSSKAMTSVTEMISGAANAGNKITNWMGMDNNSTGSCTMKEFSGAEFKFNKNITCSWYMPEQEDMARLSIARLIKMAYVRNFSMNNRGDYGKKISEAFKTMQEQLTAAGRTDTMVGEVVTSGGQMAMQAAGNVVKSVGNVISNGMDFASEFTGYDLSLDGLINGAISLNEFFGGSLTMNPMPVRLTMGHILDIEPLVITNVAIKGSKEQFMTTDGSNIPLFITADITFDMWMNPDPNKGYIRWLGDDIFNGGYNSALSEKGSYEKLNKKSSDEPVASNNSIDLTPAPDIRPNPNEPRQALPPGRKKLPEPGQVRSA